MMGCGAEPPLVPVCPIVLACVYRIHCCNWLRVLRRVSYSMVQHGMLSSNVNVDCVHCPCIVAEVIALSWLVMTGDTAWRKWDFLSWWHGRWKY